MGAHMSEAALMASYADWKLIKTRGVIQLIFELPVENADLAYRVVGGMPNASRENWFAIAKLDPTVASTPSREAAASPSSSPASRQFNDMPLSQQAGMLCNDPAFQKYLAEFHSRDWNDFSHLPDPVQAATFCVRRLCGGIASRRELLPDTPEAEKWAEIVGWYRAWQHEPSVVP